MKSLRNGDNVSVRNFPLRLNFIRTGFLRAKERDVAENTTERNFCQTFRRRKLRFYTGRGKGILRTEIRTIRQKTG